MLIYEDTKAVAASRAYELAQSGEFEDFAAIERRLFAEGFGEDIDGVKKPALQTALTEICGAKRQDSRMAHAYTGLTTGRGDRNGSD